jgi:hypothetical protein
VEDIKEVCDERFDDENHKSTILTSDHIAGDPFMFVGTNITSNYGGNGAGAWAKNKN